MRAAVDYTWWLRPDRITKPARRRDAKFVMVALADNFQPGKGIEGCRPGILRLGRMTAMSSGHVWNVLNWLEEHGYIQITRGHFGKRGIKANRYQLLFLPKTLRNESECCKDCSCM